MDSEFETITVVVGGNDCYSDRLIPDISKKYDKLIKKAKSMCQGRVTMSSICPRLDTVDVQRKIELTNTAFIYLCDTHSCRFVNNDNFFKLADKTVNDSLLMRDRVHLTWQPSNKLALNLKHNVIEYVLDNINENEINGICMFDHAKCFDTIDHKLLLKKLSKYGLNVTEL